MAIPIHVYIIGSRFCYIWNTDSARGQVSNNQANKMRAEYCLRLQVHVSVGITTVDAWAGYAVHRAHTRETILHIKLS